MCIQDVYSQHWKYKISPQQISRQQLKKRKVKTMNEDQNSKHKQMSNKKIQSWPSFRTMTNHFWTLN